MTNKRNSDAGAPERTVLVVEADGARAEELRAELERRGFVVSVRRDGTAEAAASERKSSSSSSEDDGSEKDAWKKRSMNNFAGALEESNDGYAWDWNEAKLKGKLFGVLFRNKEWEMNGRTGWTTEACATTSAKAIRDGKFNVPKDKPLNNSQAPAAPAYNEAEDTGDLPF